MTNPLRTSEDYELFIYTLAECYPSLRRSTLTFVRRGASLARVSGELHFDHELWIVIRERLVYHRLPMAIEWYGYEIWQGKRKICWYDSQPHPHEPALQSSYPHHKHVPPDIKHNRIPAPEMSFNQPNIPVLIQEIDAIARRFEAE